VRNGVIRERFNSETGALEYSDVEPSAEQQKRTVR
jgi:hypothetical protein